MIELVKNEMKQRIQEIKDKGYVYVYGAKYTGKVITVTEINQFRRDNSQVYTDKYYMDTLRMCVGKYAIDCSGLVCYVWGVKDIGSWSIAELATTQADSFDEYTYSGAQEVYFGDCLWKPGHVGLALDNARVFEASGLYSGIIETARNAKEWKKIIRPKNITEWYYQITGWVHEGDGSWWWADSHTKGDYPANTVREINGKLYCFDCNGYLVGPANIEVGDSGEIVKIQGIRWKS